MAKRLQVNLGDSEYRDIQRAARLRRMSVAEWVRRALETARQREPLVDTSKKLDVIRAAALHAFPAADIDQMLREIDRGRRDSTGP